MGTLQTGIDGGFPGNGILPVRHTAHSSADPRHHFHHNSGVLLRDGDRVGGRDAVVPLLAVALHIFAGANCRFLRGAALRVGADERDDKRLLEDRSGVSVRLRAADPELRDSRCQGYGVCAYLMIVDRLISQCSNMAVVGLIVLYRLIRIVGID